jgi:hypothetical protein
MSLLLEKSNVDLAGNFEEIVIVPDGALWYLPFEALFVGKGEHQKSLISQARVRYAPTVGLAIPYSRSHKPRPNTGVVLGKLHPQDDEKVATAAFEQLGHVMGGSFALPRSLPAASSLYRMLLDGLIVLDDIEPGDGPYDWSPAQLDRGKPGGALASWFPLPWGGPEQIVLPGFHTAAETGLRKGSSSGEDLFLSLCGLMSAGARTILISRWRPAGQTSIDLVREFEQELPHVSPAEAWQRSVQIAASTPIEPEHEPRVKKSSSHGDPPNASHPFFWSAYMLVDSGVVPEGQDNALALPGLGAANKDNPPANPAPGAKGAQPANPPLVQGVPHPAAGDPPAELQAPSKRAKKVKPPPRPAPKKTPPRTKPAPAEEPDS